jgi:predicted ribosome quality control (RQC) complex YloA/Tae2 family protein
MGFREFTTSSGKKVLAGKSAEQNEELVKQFLKKENIMFHTKKPGSPFCICLELDISKKDLKEIATFCASKSQDWRDNKSDVIVHFFSGKDVYKWKRMPAGTFGVKKNEDIKIKKKEILDFLKV